MPSDVIHLKVRTISEIILGHHTGNYRARHPGRLLRQTYREPLGKLWEAE
jgi:hypothetical protein